MSTEAGVKLDSGKPAIARGVLRYFPRAVEAVARVSEFGATKYTWDGWRDVENASERYTEALTRHLVADAIEAIDPESGMSHKAHIAWNALAILELEMQGSQSEDILNREKGQ